MVLCVRIAMEVPLVANQFNLVVKEENAENECVVLLHYEDESGAAHCEQSDELDYETFDRLTSINNDQNNVATPVNNPNEKEVVITFFFSTHRRVIGVLQVLGVRLVKLRLLFYELKKKFN